MRSFSRALAASLGVAALAACGGGSGGPSTPTTVAPAPTPTPEPAGTVRLLATSLPPGSTVAVAPMFALGQQTPELFFSAAITLRQELRGALVRAWVRTDAVRCMGGGQARVDFQAGVERAVQPASMSHPGSGSPVCALPYATTHVEFEVFDVDTQRTVLEQRFPAAYQFVAAP